MLKRDADPFHWGENNENKRKRKSRWAAADADKAFIPGMPAVIPAGMTTDQEQLYLLQIQIEEISRRLRSGDLGIPPNPEDRSPSPEPIYNNEGKRLNTREYRVRKKLEEDRHDLVTKVMSKNTDYKPPADYKPPVVRVSDKVMIPQEEHPDINFVGLLIGPRGNTLKNLEKETGAKIIIRGKGSVKEGKIGRKDGQPLPGEDEPLHAYITANNPENVKAAAEKIKEIIRQGIEVPEGQNDLRRQQLRELALLNGTLRENDGLAKLKQLQQATTIITNTIVCTVCGGTGHIAQDCKAKRPGDSLRTLQNQNPLDKAKMDSEYSALMAELGEGPPSNDPGRALINAGLMRQQFNPTPPSLLAAPTSQMMPTSKPPSLLNITTQPPPLLASMPVSSVSSAPPWQQPISSTASSSMPPPPGVMSAPPPPPPGSSQSQMFPWQQQQQQQHQQHQPPQNYTGPPPATGPLPPPWQQPPSSVAPVPPPPPNSMPPWQQHAPPQALQQLGGPPPPPPGQRGFNPVAPPPPPPSVLSELALPAGIPLGVPPPPPPK